MFDRAARRRRLGKGRSFWLAEASASSRAHTRERKSGKQKMISALVCVRVCVPRGLAAGPVLVVR